MRVVRAGKKVKLKSPAKPKVDPARQRALTHVQDEFGRLMLAVDDAKRVGTVSMLDAVANILSHTYPLIDVCVQRG